MSRQNDHGKAKRAAMKKNNAKPLTASQKDALFAALAADAKRDAAIVADWSAAREKADATKTEEAQAESDFQWDLLCGRYPQAE